MPWSKPVARCGACLLALTLSGSAPAQPQERAPATATLPESNEALLLAGRVEDAIRRGDFRLAIELVEQTRKLPPGLAPAPASRTYYPIWRHAQRLLAQLPAGGIELYRQLHDAEVKARFERAAKTGDLSVLRELFHIYRLSSAWNDIGRELAAQLIDRGLDGEAVEVLRELRAADAEQDPFLRAQLAVALAGAGVAQAAEDLVAGLLTDENLKRKPEWTERLARLRRWLASRSAAAGVTRGGARFAAALPGELHWTATLGPAGADAGSEDDAACGRAIDQLRRLPLQRAVVAGDVLVVRVRGGVHAFDLDTLTPLWSAREIGTGWDVSAAELSPLADLGLDLSAAELTDVTLDCSRLLGDASRHALSAGLGLVFSLEGAGIASGAEWSFGRRSLGQFADGGAPSELVARDLHTGRFVWRTGGELADPLYGAVFQDVPIVVGERLVAPVQRGGDLRLVVLEPRSGKLVQEIPIVGPPTRFSATGGRCPLALDETSLYVGTGNGVVAALSRDTLEWRWAAVYPSALGDNLARFWGQVEAPRHEPGPEALIVSDDLLISAALDSDELLALDRFSGRERWRVPRGDSWFVVGVSGGGLVLGGSGLTCVELADGRTVRWKTVPLAVSGRPTIDGRSIYVPTPTGIVVVDARNGKIIADGALRSAAAATGGAADSGAARAGAALRPVAANLMALGDGLIGVSPNRVFKVPDAGRMRPRLEQRLAANPQDVRAGLALAWLDGLSGAWPAALERLRGLRPSETALKAARNQLMVRVCQAMARGATSSSEQLAWLKEASELADAPEDAAQLALLKGQALEKAGLADDALRHYRAMLLQTGPKLTVVDDADGVRRAPWLMALLRLRPLLAAAGPAAREAFAGELVAGLEIESESPGPLVRALRLVDGVDEAARLRRALVRARLTPEQALRFLPALEDGVGPEEQRRILLKRWETHVSLGMLAESRVDRAQWIERFAAAAEAEERSTRDLVESLQELHAKLERRVCEPFGADFSQSARQWKLKGYELLLDPRHTPAVLPATLPVRKFEDSRLELCQLVQGTVKPVTLSPNPARAATSVQRLVREALENPAGVGNTSVIYGNFALTPLRGALLCLGLGAERYGGRQQWQAAIPEWRSPPATFANATACGLLGVYVTPRADRIVLLDWLDGRPVWQRELPGLKIERIYVCGERLVLIGSEQQVVTLSAETGGELRELPADVGTLAKAVVVGDVLIGWGAGSMVGLDVGTLSPLWRSAGGAVQASFAAPQRGWVAHRNSDAGGWRLTDVHTGATLFEGRVPELRDMTALHAAGDVVYFGGFGPPLRPDDPVRPCVVAAFDLSEQRVLWTHQVDTLAPLQPSQLAAHAAYVPLVLVKASGENRMPDPRTLKLQLVDKRDGKAGEELAKAEFFSDRTAAAGDVFMVATPSRIIVNGFGTIVAFGSALGKEP